MAKNTNSPDVIEIDADQWAESGGTAGMFAKNWKNGTLRIVSVDEKGERTVTRKSKYDA